MIFPTLSLKKVIEPNRAMVSKILSLIPNAILRTHWKLWLQKNRTRLIRRKTKILQYSVEYTDPLSLYFEFKNIFKNNIYYFQSQKNNPLIIDAGSCIGMSILYFKSIYPKARILGFEPDGELFAILKHNMEANHITDVELKNAALNSQNGELAFYPDGTDGGSAVFQGNKQPSLVRAVRLSEYLTEPVDFLKMNIEGAEGEVLREISDKLHLIKEMVIEYHSFENQRQDLHQILELLTQNGFRYLINDFDDGQTNPAVKTPFYLDERTRYFLLIYAKRMGLNNNEVHG